MLVVTADLRTQNNGTAFWEGEEKSTKEKKNPRPKDRNVRELSNNTQIPFNIDSCKPVRKRRGFERPTTASVRLTPSPETRVFSRISPT